MSDESTKLWGKEYSPLVIRRYNHLGIPVFVALITDDNLSNLDDVVTSVLREFEKKIEGKKPTIQDFRDLCGHLTEVLRKHYKKAEGIAVVAYPDKAAVSSLWGDFMHHWACRGELYFLLSSMVFGV